MNCGFSVEQRLVGEENDGTVYSVEDAQSIINQIRHNYKSITMAEASLLTAVTFVRLQLWIVNAYIVNLQKKYASLER